MDNLFNKLCSDFGDLFLTSSEKITKQEEIKNDVSEELDDMLYHYMLQNKKLMEQRTTKTDGIKMTEMPNKTDADDEWKKQLKIQNEYLCCIKEQDQEIARLSAQSQKYSNDAEYNVPEQKLDITTFYNEFIMEKLHMRNNILELQRQILQLKYEKQQYMEIIKKFANKFYFDAIKLLHEDTCAKLQQFEQQISKKCEKNMYDFELRLSQNVVMQRQMENMICEKLDVHATAMNKEKEVETKINTFVTDLSELKNLHETLEKKINTAYELRRKIKNHKTWMIENFNKNCITSPSVSRQSLVVPFERENCDHCDHCDHCDLCSRMKIVDKESDNTIVSCNVLTSQESFLEKETQLSLDIINSHISTPSKLQSTIKGEVIPEIVTEDCNKDSITSPSKQLTLEDDFVHISKNEISNNEILLYLPQEM